MSYEHVDVELHQLGCELRETVVPTLCPSIMDDDVLVLLVSALAQTSSQAVNLASILRVREHAEKTDPVVPGLLRARRERSRCRASEQRDEIAATDVDCHVTLPWGSCNGWDHITPKPCCAAGFQSGLCLLRVRLGHSAMSAQCPACPKADMAG
jgi:hypothetical protein